MANMPANVPSMPMMPPQMPFVDPEAEFEAGRAHEPTPAPTPGAPGARGGAAPPGPAAGLNSFPHGRGGGGGGGAEGAPAHHQAGPMMMHPDFVAGAGENGSAVTGVMSVWTTATIRPMVPDIIVQRFPTIEMVANESAINVQNNVVSGAASASPVSAWVKINITDPKSQVTSV